MKKESIYKSIQWLLFTVIPALIAYNSFFKQDIMIKELIPLLFEVFKIIFLIVLFSVPYYTYLKIKKVIKELQTQIIVSRLVEITLFEMQHKTDYLMSPEKIKLERQFKETLTTKATKEFNHLTKIEIDKLVNERFDFVQHFFDDNTI